MNPIEKSGKEIMLLVLNALLSCNILNPEMDVLFVVH